MNQPQLDEIGVRLTLLERENRRLKRVGAAAAAGVFLLLIGGARADRGDDVLRGKRLVLESKGGDAGLTLGAGPDGEPAVTLRRTIRGKAYSMEMRMLVAGDGVPVLLFEDQAGTIRYRIPR